MWQVEPTDLFNRRLKKYRKKHGRETVAVLNNLNTYLATLNQGSKPLQIKAGWIHIEPHGVIAIDQKGGGKDLKQTRLYVYTYEVESVVYLITVGDKQSQKSDIQDCKSFMNELRKDN